MATSTPHLSLSLLGIGESVGTWGIPLNNNFSKVDILAGELINARGSETDLNNRFGTIESELAAARGILPNLSDRLSVMLQTDGNIRIENMPKSTSTGLGVTRLSVNPVDLMIPIAVGDNDTRMLTQPEKDALTTGALTHIHKHNLDDDIVDVTATANEINQSLDGIGGTVTAANLTALTDGGETTLHTHQEAGYNIKGFAQLSVTPAVAEQPIAVGTNDTRVLTQGNHDALTTGNVTAVHRHNLVDGAADLTVDAATLNRLTGAGTNVTASNLDALTGGSSTALHNHNNQYYTKAESDSQNTANQAYTDTELSTHDNSDLAHQGANLDLGDVSVNSIIMDTVGIKQTIRSNVGDAATAVKQEVKDSSGVTKFSVDASGSVICHDLTVQGTQTVVETTTLSQDAVATSNLSVNGNSTLGDNALVDNLTVNCSLSTFNGPITVNGGISTTGTVDGVDVAQLGTDFAAVQGEVTSAKGSEASIANRFAVAENDINVLEAEVIAARGGQASVDARLDASEADITSHEAEIVAARNGELNINARLGNIESTHATFAARNDNPLNVTITQAVAADGSTDVTGAELETLTDGSNADALHIHTVTDGEILNAKTSSVYGVFPTMSARHDASDAILNSHETELVNARNGELSLDARLDAMDLIDQDHAPRISALETADGLQDTRMDGIDAEVLLRTRKFTETIGAAATTWTHTHNLNTKDVVVKVYDGADAEVFQANITSITTTDLNTVTIVFPGAVTGRVVIVG